ncbi:MAG: UDP-N-acetylmuramate--L-alanine ligase [Nocardioidaceae bacterium]
MIVEVPEKVAPVEELGRVHLVGIGGAALSGLARILMQRGVRVSGSDAQDSAALRHLRALGITCFVGHSAEHVAAADTVVVSTAVPEDNPEVVAARERGLRLWPRAAAVESVLQGHRAVVVTGTHGKTTTTSMLATALLACGAEPSYAIGSTLVASGLNAALGGGDLFVVEGDESDGAILAYHPAAAVVTNVDVDHLDHYGTPRAYAAVFDRFIQRIEPTGFLVCCIDDPGALRLASLARDQGVAVVTVGLSPECHLQARDIRFSGSSSAYEVWDAAGGFRGRVLLQVPGTNYVVDSLAALAAGLELGFDFDQLAAGLHAFLGSGRRMELKGRAGGVTVYDSYAHHPVEIAGDLQAARALAGEGRIVVCFQPHLYSRTRIFGAEMGHALGASDQVVVMDVYAARETPQPGVDGSLVADGVPLPAAQVVYEPVWGRAARRVVEAARPGDLVLTLGAGDVTRVAGEVLLLLARDGADGRDDTR